MLLAHVVADYVIQDKKTVLLKGSKRIGHGIHLLEHGIPTILAALIFYNLSWQLTVQIILLLTAHYTIDRFKCMNNQIHVCQLEWDSKIIWRIKKVFLTVIKSTYRRPLKFKEPLVHIFDQVIHITSIIIICGLFDNGLNAIGQSTMGVFQQFGYSLDMLKDMIVIIIGGIYATFGGMYTIPQIFREIDPNGILKKDNHETSTTENEKLEHDLELGKYIGFFERFLLYVLIISKQYSAAGVVIAVKSLARFNQLSDKTFAEYYLVGTLLSISIVVIFAGIVTFLI